MVLVHPRRRRHGRASRPFSCWVNGEVGGGGGVGYPHLAFFVPFPFACFFACFLTGFFSFSTSWSPSSSVSAVLAFFACMASVLPEDAARLRAARVVEALETGGEAWRRRVVEAAERVVRGIAVVGSVGAGGVGKLKG